MNKDVKRLTSLDGTTDELRGGGASEGRPGDTERVSWTGTTQLTTLPQSLPELPVVERDFYLTAGELARGGLGRILEAYDRRLDRTVAIKELIAGSPRTAARFVREARVSARLQHPAIVPVYEAGRWPDGEIFYTMKLISGRSLRETIEGTKNLDERLALLPNVIAAVDAMAYAHGQGVIHRDLKPSNILVGPFGETVVIDWGLAKDLAQPPEEDLPDSESSWRMYEHDLTLAGSVMGTPQYMPPEQARGEPVDERADVYMLGAVLYNLLAGVPPYLGETPTEVLSKVLAEPPVPLEERHRGVPHDLATIVRKAMARNKEDRYPTAKELAEDLRRFQTGQLVSAREYSRVALLGRWLRRHRAWVAVVMVFVALLFTGASIAFRRVLDERNVAEAKSNELLLVQARTSLERDPTATLAWLKTYPAQGTGWEEVRDLALDAVSRGVSRHILRRDETVPAFSAFSPDGRLFAGSGAGKRLNLWDTTTGKVVMSFACHDELNRVAFAPDGRTIAFSEGDGTLTIGEVAGGRTRSLTHVADAVSLAFSPDGQSLLVGSGDHMLQLWMLATGERKTLTGFEGVWGGGASFSPDGRTIAFAHQDGAVWLWQVGGGTRSLPGQAGHLRTLAFSPDGRQVITGGEDKQLRLWDVATGENRVLVRYQAALGEVAFSPDGRWVAASALEWQVRMIEVATGKAEILGEHLGQVYAVAFSPDGRLLATAGQDATVRLWEIETGDRWVLQGHGGPVYQVLFSPDGRLLASISEDRTTRMWTVPAHRSRVLRGHEDDVGHVAFSPDGRRVATASRDSSIRLWDAATGQEVQRGQQKLVRWIAFTPDGQQLVSTSYDGQLRLWDLTTLKTREVGSTHGPIGAHALSPDGRSLATGSPDGAVRLWDVATGAERTLVMHQGEVRALGFSPDGRLLASGGVDRLVLLSEVATGLGRPLRGHAGPLVQVVFSHDGRYLASSAGKDGVWLWDTSSGEGRALVGREVLVRQLAFSPDDRWLAGGSEDGRLGLWNRFTGDMHALRGHSDGLQDMLFIQGGRSLASTSVDGTLRLWDVDSFSACRLERHDAGIIDLALSPDERTLATSSVDRTARLWRVDACPRLPLEPDALHGWINEKTTVVILQNGLASTP